MCELFNMILIVICNPYSLLKLVKNIPICVCVMDDGNAESPANLSIAWIRQLYYINPP
jgi:hypothetical protein